MVLLSSCSSINESVLRQNACDDNERLPELPKISQAKRESEDSPPYFAHSKSEEPNQSAHVSDEASTSSVITMTESDIYDYEIKRMEERKKALAEKAQLLCTMAISDKDSVTYAQKYFSYMAELEDEQSRKWWNESPDVPIVQPPFPSEQAILEIKKIVLAEQERIAKEKERIQQEIYRQEQLKLQESQVMIQEKQALLKQQELEEQKKRNAEEARHNALMEFLIWNALSK